MKRTEITLALPDWVGTAIDKHGASFETVEARMQFAIALARNNIERKTGGPFGAGIFEIETGRLVAPGVNLVTTVELLAGPRRDGRDRPGPTATGDL